MRSVKTTWRRQVLYISIGIAVIFGMFRVYVKLTDDFRVANITYEIPFNPDWEIPHPDPKDQVLIQEILNQEFTFLGKGAQTYAFSSADNKWVIKFFKFKHHKPNWRIWIIPTFPPFDKIRERKIAKHKRKLDAAFIGYKLAYDENRKDSGILTMHLNRTDHLKKQILVRDKMGFKREIDLDNVVYVIQEKATPTQKIITDLLNEGKISLAKQRIDQLFDLYFQEYDKGIYDRDRCIFKNSGFIGNRPIHFDVGKLSKDEALKDPDTKKEDLKKITQKMKVWLNKHQPKYYAELSQYLDQKVDEIYSLR